MKKSELKQGGKKIKNKTSKKMMKIEIEILVNKYNELKFYCRKRDVSVEDKVREIIINAINSAEIDNF